jgi:3'-phosphoadenosine 5'-phosphosulfate sulfotransferase (PAPS reductase)/FAD synthetase
MNEPYTICWFSAGVSSAVACKLAIEEIDEVLYIHIDDQHDDTLRFVKDVEAWIGKPITILQCDHCKTVREACFEEKLTGKGSKFIAGPWGAKCTGILKKHVRETWERENADKYPFRYVWGFDAGEAKRIERVIETQPEFTHLFPLADHKMHKEELHQVLKASGIKRPAMYDLGYHNNNCVGCVKGGMGYWNKIRKDFPEVFADRAAMEREVGASCMNGTYLDELNPEAGRDQKPIVEECGILCGIMNLNNQQSRKK